MLFIWQHDKKWPQAFCSTLETFPPRTEMGKDRTQKLLLWLIFLQFRRNGFNSMRVLDSGSQLRTHQNAGPNIKITDTGLYFNFKGPLSNSVEDRGRNDDRNWRGKKNEISPFGIRDPGLQFKCQQGQLERALSSQGNKTWALSGTGCLALRAMLNLSELKSLPQISEGTTLTKRAGTWKQNAQCVGCWVKRHTAVTQCEVPERLLPFTPSLKREQTRRAHGSKMAESQMEPWIDQK